MASPGYRGLHQLADRHEPAFATAIEATVVGLARQVTEDAVSLDMEDPGEPVRTLGILDGWQVTKARERDPTGLYAEILSGAAVRAAPDIAASLRLTSPSVIRAAERLTAHLITDVTETTKQAVRKIISDAWRDGMAPRESAKLVKRIIGLDRRRATALANFTRAQAGRPNADAHVGKYAQRLVKDRALTIARSETIRAANSGVQLGWREMQNAGLLPAAMEQIWIVAADDRLCELCAPMSGQVVSVRGMFQSTVRGVLPSEREEYSGATVEQPPLHPRLCCRCTIGAA